MNRPGPSTGRGDLAIRVALAAVVGLGFVPSTVGATLSFAGFDEPAAVVGGILAAIAAFGWIVRESERVR